ncbi:uncharacterized protein TrAtP1_013334 [Trichoderma atroviride]|uniref:uncharacterized protein n=1 Tax=Hypocrea atroviridis TaxID=63577 RepID=UPI00331E873D|nr:hypothetical protein TrAtP1_013334 [Trichoderma atroviride]
MPKHSCIQTAAAGNPSMQAVPMIARNLVQSLLSPLNEPWRWMHAPGPREHSPACLCYLTDAGCMGKRNEMSVTNSTWTDIPAILRLLSALVSVNRRVLAAMPSLTGLHCVEAPLPVLLALCP